MHQLSCMTEERRLEGSALQEIIAEILAQHHLAQKSGIHMAAAAQ
jgi:hypothetical protein